MGFSSKRIVRTSLFHGELSGYLRNNAKRASESLGSGNGTLKAKSGMEDLSATHPTNPKPEKPCEFSGMKKEDCFCCSKTRSKKVKR